MLIAGGALMIMARLVFVLTRNFVVLVIAATIGVISPSGNEVDPFLAIEQASLSHVINPRRRTAVFAWYALAGSLSTTLGSLTGGVLAQALQHSRLAAWASYRVIVIYMPCPVWRSSCCLPESQRLSRSPCRKRNLLAGFAHD